MKSNSYKLSVEGAPTLKIKQLLLKPTHFYYLHGDPGKLSGLPENCYPPTQSEFEIETLYSYNEGEKEWELVPQSVIEFLEDEFMDELCEQMDEWAQEEKEERENFREEPEGR